jgi:hypothetical protein
MFQIIQVFVSASGPLVGFEMSQAGEGDFDLLCAKGPSIRDREGPHGLPLPHHRTYGSRIRRFGGLSQGETSPQPKHRFPACQR